MKLALVLVIAALLLTACHPEPQHVAVVIDNYQMTRDDNGASFNRVINACNAGATDLVITTRTQPTLYVTCDEALGRAATTPHRWAIDESAP